MELCFQPSSFHNLEILNVLKELRTPEKKSVTIDGNIQKRLETAGINSWDVSLWPNKKQLEFFKNGKFLCADIKDVLWHPPTSTRSRENIDFEKTISGSNSTIDTLTAEWASIQQKRET